MGLKRITFNGYKHQFNGFIVSVGYENLTDLLNNKYLNIEFEIKLKWIYTLHIYHTNNTNEE